MKNDSKTESEVFEAEVLESSVIDEGRFKKVLLQAGKRIALPAVEAFEMIQDKSTPMQARVSLIAALTYLIMPIDLVPDFIPIAGFSDDFVALTAVISLWSSNITPEIKKRAQQRIDSWFQV